MESFDYHCDRVADLSLKSIATADGALERFFFPLELFNTNHYATRRLFIASTFFVDDYYGQKFRLNLNWRIIANFRFAPQLS